MKIELKNIEFSERMSEETNCFTANLYIEGKLAGTTNNRGHGGPTDYYASSPEGKELIKQAEQFCLALPPEKYGEGEGMFTYNMNLEHYIDNLLGEYLKQKEQKKITAKMKDHILISSNPEVSYTAYRVNYPIKTMLDTAKGNEYLVGYLCMVKDQLKAGQKILNTNIPEQLYKDAGLSETQFVLPEPKQEIKKPQVKQKSKRI